MCQDKCIIIIIPMAMYPNSKGRGLLVSRAQPLLRKKGGAGTRLGACMPLH
ncbi:MAG: hypothetical protein MJE68_16625 [Proteobacteria bacterium]|nr:hypothetical protein [Pseudomonadota bacterium]